MEANIAAQLSAINRQFYQTFASSFSATRARVQPGVARILQHLPTSASILDLGCGNGSLANELIRRGWQGSYLGIDASPGLLETAIQRCAGVPGFSFLLGDLTSPSWSDALTENLGFQHRIPFDLIFAFAVLHHVPGEAARLTLLKQARTLLTPPGRFIHSEWQFLSSPRWRSRLQPWEVVDLSPADLDPGDYLLDWRHGGYGLRYVHHFSLPELENLAQQAGFAIRETFLSDGEGGKLGLYQIWEPS